MRTPIWLALTICGICVCQEQPGAQESVPPAPVPQAVVTAHAPVHASLQRIARKSALWRQQMDAVQRLGRQVFVLGPEEVIVADTADGHGRGRFEEGLIAAAAPVADQNENVHRVLVVIDFDLLEEAHRRQGSLQGEIEADLDALIVHEIYGHALPYLLAGHLSERCADPAPGQRAEESCAIRRENEVRKELGLIRRTSYGIAALHLARGRF